MHKLSIEIVFSDSSVNLSLFSDILDATVDVVERSWRLTQDLRAINSLIIPLALILPNEPSADYSKFYTTQSHPLHGGVFAFSFLLHPRPCIDSAVICFYI